MRDAAGDDVAPDELRERLRAALGARYAVGNEIGHGATAIVYAARDLLHFEREVALKVIRPEVVVALGVARFQREMQLAAQLNHPHIVPLLDWGDTDGLLYYVMPRVHGESLRARLQREQQLALDDAVRITRDIAGALQHAHGHGIAHRDVKPENILLVEGEASLGDFGLAREVAGRPGESVTESGIAVGTAAYMSPEQASGGGGNARSDQYSLACVLYEMLAGDPPFHASTVQGMLARHRSDAPPRLTTIRPSLPAGVDEAVQRALAKVPAERFASVAQFATAVETALTGATLAAVRAQTPTGEQSEATRVGGKRRLALGSIAATAAIALAWWVVKALDVMPGDRAPPLDPNRLAVAPFDVFHPADSVWREGLVDLLSRSLDAAGPLRTAPPSLVVARWSGRADVVSATTLGRQLGAGLVVYGQFVRNRADSVRVHASLLSVRSGQVREVEVTDELLRADRIADSITVRVLRTLGETRAIAAVPRASLRSRSILALKAFLQGEQLYRKNSFVAARPLYERAIELDSSFTLAYRRMRGVLRLDGEFDVTSLRYAERAGALNSGLTLRDSLLVLADSLAAAVAQPPGFVDEQTRWRIRRRLEILDRATRVAPSDPEVWLEYAEALHHFGSWIGATHTQALEAFEQSIALDPDFALAYFHAIELAVETRGADSARRLAARYLTANPADQRFVLVHDLLARNAADREATIARSVALAGDSLFTVAYVLRRWHDSTRVSDRVLERLALSREARHASETSRAHELRAGIALYNGQLDARVRASTPAILLGYPVALILLARYGLFSDSVERSVYRTLASSPRPRDWLFATSGYGARADTTGLTRMRARFDSLLSARSSRDAFTRAIAGYGTASALAYLTLARADTPRALARFERLPDTLCTWVCVPDRLVTVRLLRAAKRSAEAARRLDLLPPSASAHLPTEVFWSLERARVAHEMGDRESAARWARLVLQAWMQSDPALRRTLNEARRIAGI